MAVVNKAQLADLVGFSERTLTEWQGEGMPIAGSGTRGQENAYDSAAVIAWMLERAVRRARADHPKDELYRSQKKLIDLQIAEKQRVLVDAGAVESEYARLVGAARTRFLQIAARLAPALEEAAGEKKKRELLESAIESALQELSEYEPGDPPGARPKDIA